MRRKHKRIFFKRDEVRAETVTEVKAKVSNLSMLGMAVKSPKRLKAGSPCLISFGRNGKPAIFHGIAVWERFAGWSVNPLGFSNPLFSAGIKLGDQNLDFMKRAGAKGCDATREVRVTASDLTVLLSYPESLSVINLSLGGLLAESFNPMEPGSEHTARLYLPDSAEPVKCIGKITSCETVRVESEKRYHIGFEFIAMNESQTERLKTFIRMRSSL